MNIYCEICTDLFDETKDATSTLCGHIFHESCIKTWIKYSRTCPKCRNPVNEATIIRLFFSTFDSEAKSNEYLRNGLTNLKASVYRKNLEIIKKEMAEIEVKRHILDIKMHVVRLEQRVNSFQLKHLKALMTTKQLCLALKNVVEDLISATRIMKNVLERNVVQKRAFEIEIFKKVQNILSACNDFSRNTRSRNFAIENMVPNLPSDVRRMIPEIRILNNAQEFKMPQNILSTHNLCSRNTKESNSAVRNKTPYLPTSSFLSDHVLLCSRYRRTYNIYGKNICMQRKEELCKSTEMPVTNSLEINTDTSRISADTEPENQEVIKLFCYGSKLTEKS